MGQALMFGQTATSGSSAKGLDVTIAAALPTAVIENRILCITETGAGMILADTVRPSGTAGDIWIEMGSEEDLVALGSETNRVNVRPVMVWQHSGTGWNLIDAYLGRDGAWVQISSSVTEMGVRHIIANGAYLLERLGAAAGLSATAGVGTVPQETDFDTMPIYREIRRCNLNADGTVAAWEGEEGFSTATADVMVYIPKFWYKRVHDGTNDEWWIADGPVEGYAVHPAFARGTPFDDLDGFFVAAFPAGTGYQSVSGVAQLTNITRATARSGARAKGTGWYQLDVAAVEAINTLIYIEYASLHGQEAIGPGNSATSAVQQTGTTDSMAGHTGRPAGTANAVGMKWRGIENWWGNAWIWVDGLNMNGNAYYFCLDPDSYADDTATYYTAAGLTAGSNGFVKEVGYSADHPWLMVPTTTGGSETTFFCDYAYTTTSGWRVARFGGNYGVGAYCGPACWDLSNTSTSANASIGCRLLYLKP